MYVILDKLNLPAGRVTTSKQMATLSKWGRFYRFSTKIRINKDVDSFATIFHFTTGANCCAIGSRLPGIFQGPRNNRIIEISNAVADQGDYKVSFRFELNKWYEIVIEQPFRGANVSSNRNFLQN